MSIKNRYPNAWVAQSAPSTVSYMARFTDHIGSGSTERVDAFERNMCERNNSNHCERHVSPTVRSDKQLLL